MSTCVAGEGEQGRAGEGGGAGDEAGGRGQGGTGRAGQGRESAYADGLASAVERLTTFAPSCRRPSCCRFTTLQTRRA